MAGTLRTVIVGMGTSMLALCQHQRRCPDHGLQPTAAGTTPSPPRLKPIATRRRRYSDRRTLGESDGSSLVYAASPYFVADVNRALGF